MHYTSTGQLVFSPSDLNQSMRSSFGSWLDRLALEQPELTAAMPKDNDPMMALLASKGNAHETSFLLRLQELHGMDSVAVVHSETPGFRAKETHAYMSAGAPFIYQAQLQREQFSGNADFLVRKPGPSNLGDYHYEAWDTKLSLTAKHFFLVQLCCYSWMLEGIQGKRPDEAVIVLGDMAEDRFQIAKYFDYFLRVKREFLAAQAGFKADLGFMPDPAFDNDYGRWASYAKQVLETTDSLALVAGIRKSHIRKLRKAGIVTMAGLASWQGTDTTGIPQTTLAKLQAQADIQHQSKGLDKPLFKVIQDGSDKGLCALPPASALDVYFDIEGHPLLDGGLEYLWGASYRCPDAAQGRLYAYKDWWAHTPEQEKLAFEGFIDWAYGRWQVDRTMHIYHYANYEVAAMRKLSIRHDTRLKEVAELLANNVMVDLYRIVRNGILLGEPKYSIKNVEHVYRGKRSTDVASGGDSVIHYEAWREQGGVKQWCDHGYPLWTAKPDSFDWGTFPALNGLRLYNIDDTESTLECTEWLRGQQQLHGIAYAIKTEDDKPVQEKTGRQLQNAEKKQELQGRIQRLIDRHESDGALKADPKAQLMVALLGFHNRERKPKIWAYFERLNKTGGQLYDDDTALHKVTLVKREVLGDDTKLIGHYDPKQPIRKDKFVTGTLKGSELKIKAIAFVDNEQAGRVELTMASGDCEGLNDDELTVFADELYINTDKLETRLCEVCEALFAGGHPATVETLLGRLNPAFIDGQGYLPITRERYPDNKDYLNAIIKTVKAMANTCLAIQGPPGAGKTFTAKHIITELVQDGNRVGILSNSHAAILNLLDALHEPTGHAPIAKVGGYGNNQDAFREKYHEEDYPNYVYRTSMVFTKKQPYESFAVVGATANGFSADIAFEHPLDYLFVDEASQVPLANLVAVMGSARNIVLMGDQMQLPNPTQGSHPNNGGVSALEWLLGNHSVIPESQGIFLEKTYRMHGDVCHPLSDVVYEGKLVADGDNQHQSVKVTDGRLVTQATGILVVPVEHDGNRQSSEEEASAINDLIDELKTGTYTDKDGETRLMTDGDILVVAPHNMQVNLLKERLKGNCAIGTVDKFQGKEAQVVIISMSVSDIEESSRGLDFVFDINRLNVAVSRAKALAIIVANPGLERCKVNGIPQMEKASFFSRLVN